MKRDDFTLLKSKGKDKSPLTSISFLLWTNQQTNGEQNTDCHNELATLMSIKTNKKIQLLTHLWVEQNET